VTIAQTWQKISSSSF